MKYSGRTLKDNNCHWRLSIAWTTSIAALAVMTQFRRSWSVVCIHVRSMECDAMERETKVRNPVIAQYATTVAATTKACHTHTKALGIPRSQSNSRPAAKAATITVAVGTRLRDRKSVV